MLAWVRKLKGNLHPCWRLNLQPPHTHCKPNWLWESRSTTLTSLSAVMSILALFRVSTCTWVTYSVLKLLNVFTSSPLSLLHKAFVGLSNRERRCQMQIKDHLNICLMFSCLIMFLGHSECGKGLTWFLGCPAVWPLTGLWRNTTCFVARFPSLHTSTGAWSEMQLKNMFQERKHLQSIFFYLSCRMMGVGSTHVSSQPNSARVWRSGP